jgi:hypothetical protein
LPASAAYWKRRSSLALSVLTYLEQHSPDEIVPAKEQPVEIRRVEEVSPEFARYLYTAVGGHWHWIGKLGWNWDNGSTG